MAQSFEDLITQHGAEVLSALSQRLYEDDGPQGQALAKTLLDELRAVVARALTHLLAADEALRLEADDDKQYRDARDSAYGRLRAVLMDVRGLIEAAYGAQALAAYALEQELPRSPELLYESAERTTQALRSIPVSAPSPFGFELELGLLADKIETEVVPLGMAMEDIRREVREIQEALKARNEAMADFDRVKEASAQILGGYFRLANRPDLAMMLGR